LFGAIAWVLTYAGHPGRDGRFVTRFVPEFAGNMSNAGPLPYHEMALPASSAQQ